MVISILGALQWQYEINKRSEMKKVLFAINNLEGGGAERVLVDLINGLDRNKYIIDLFLIDKTGPYLKRLNDNINIISAYDNYNKKLEKFSAHVLCRFNTRFTRKLLLRYNHDFTKEFLKKASSKELYHHFFSSKDYDIEIAFLEGISTKIIAGSSSQKSIKIAWVHTDLVDHLWFSKWFQSEAEIKENYQNFHQVVCVSEKIKESFQKEYQRDACVKLNPIDTVYIECKANSVVDLKKKENVFYYIAVGRFTREKGFERLLRIRTKLIRMGYKIELWILGKGELQEELESIIKTEHIEDSVKLLGFQNNPYKYMKQSDLYICSSYIEGLSTTVIEALALGIPVLTTECPGMAELLGNSEYGIIVENEESALLKGMIDI